VVRKILKPNEWEDYGYSEDEWWTLTKGKRWRLRHPEKMKAAVKSWVSRNKEYVSTRHRKYELKNKYGMSEEQYDVLLLSQDNRCAICNTDTPTGKWRVFAVDHCHTTGNVRGLLCNECNRGMGLLRDNAELLRRAADYLDHHAVKTKAERKKK